MVHDSKPGGYWSVSPALGLMVVICTAAIFYVGWDFIALETTQRVSERYDRQAEAYPSNEEIARLCAGRPEAERIECAIDEVESREKWDQDRRDLHAQEGMEFWAKWMFLAAFFGTAVAGYGLALLRRTWVETKRTADVTREIGEAQVRAYISIQALEFGREENEGDYPLISVGIGNAGASPALGMEVVVRMIVHPGAKEMIINFGCRNIPGGSDQVCSATHAHARLETDAWGEHLERVNVIYFEVFAYGLDVFNKEISDWEHFELVNAGGTPQTTIAPVNKCNAQLAEAFIDERVARTRMYALKQHQRKKGN